jgi:hypothetical protein
MYSNPYPYNNGGLMKKSIIAIIISVPCIFLASASSAALAEETPIPISCTVDSNDNTQCYDQPFTNPPDTSEPTPVPVPVSVDCSTDSSPCERGGVVMYDKQVSETAVTSSDFKSSSRLVFLMLFWGLLLSVLFFLFCFGGRFFKGR